MKKVLLATAFVALELVGCSSNSDEDKSTESTVAKSEVEVESTVSSSSTVESTVESSAVAIDKITNKDEVAEGSFDIVNVYGYTVEGADIVVYYDTNTSPTNMGIDTADINGGLLSYIYVDGQLITKEQLGTSQTSIELQDTPKAIKEGVHT